MHPRRGARHGRPRPLPGGRRRQGHRGPVGHGERGERARTASGSATRSRPEAPTATTTRCSASPLAASGSRCKRHFRELGIEPDDGAVHGGRASVTCPETSSATACSTPTDSSCVAAFDHRHVFLDPSRIRRHRSPSGSACSRLPGSSWGDYDRSVLSEGGRGDRPHGEVGDAVGPGARGPRDPRRRAGRDDARGRDPVGAPGTGRPALERRDRHVRQGGERGPHRGRATARTTPSGSTGTRSTPAWWGRVATSASHSAGGSSTRSPVDGSTRTSSTTPPASTPRTGR